MRPSTGLSIGVFFILSEWITGSTIIIAMQAIISYGLLAGLGYALSTTFGIFLLALILHKRKRAIFQPETWTSFWRARSSKAGFQIIFALSLFTRTGTLWLQLVAGGLILKVIFNLPPNIGQALFLVVGISLNALSSRYRKWWRYLSKDTLALLKIALPFSVALFLPITLFLRDGIEPIYKGVRLYHPYLLVTNNLDVLYFFSAVILIHLGIVLLNHSIWEHLGAFNRKKGVPTLLLGGLIGGTIPLAFSSLIFVVIFRGGFQNLASIISDLIAEIRSPLLFLLFVTSLLGLILFSLVGELKGIRDLVREQSRISSDGFLALSSGRALGFSAILIILAFLLSLLLQPALLPSFFFFGIIPATAFPPLFIGIWIKRPLTAFLPGVSVLSAIIGWVTFTSFGPLVSLLVGAGTSLISALLVLSVDYQIKVS